MHLVGTGACLPSNSLPQVCGTLFRENRTRKLQMPSCLCAFVAKKAFGFSLWKKWLLLKQKHLQADEKDRVRDYCPFA